jgi:hypothetical protein
MSPLLIPTLELLLTVVQISCQQQAVSRVLMRTTVSVNFELNDLALIGNKAGLTLVLCGSWCGSKPACSAYSFARNTGLFGDCRIGRDPSAKRPLQGARVYYRVRGI